MSGSLPTCLAAAALAALLPSLLPAQQTLPRPRTDTGMPLMQALAERASKRVFSPAPLAPDVLGELLWAAAGVNRPDGRRTTPSARNFQEVDVYVAMADGLYLYDHRAHALQRVLGEDLRAATGRQDFVATAPVNLVYVADLARLAGTGEQDRVLYPAIAAGAMVQSVYLYAASAGLATVVRALVDREALAAAMHLRPDQRIIICQTVGMPAGS